MVRNTFMIGILCASLAGCQAGQGGGGAAGNGAAAAGGADSKSTAAGGDSPATRVVGYLDGRPISHNDLQAALYEAAGGQVLAELILDRRIAKRLAELEDELRRHSDIAPERLDPVERAILSLGIWELTSRPEVPYRVVINEGIELAKRFGATDGHRYVNAVLDRASRAHRGAERGEVA